MTKKKQKSYLVNIISIIISLIGIISLSFLTYKIYTTKVLPMKYFVILIITIILLLAIFFLFIINKKTKKWLLIILDILFITGSSLCIFGTYKINEVLNFMEANLGAKYETNVYYVLVNNESIYTTTDSIKEKKVLLVDDLGDKKELERNIKKKVKVEFEYTDDVTDLLNRIKEDKELIIIVNSGNYDAMIENELMLELKEKFTDKVKILETIEIQSKVVNESTGIDVKEDPFVVYLSGIDTRSNKLPARSLSDVNIIVAVNPITNKILLINTPRDYLVEIYGKGKLDKLIHAGIIGGYKTSLKTVETLYQTKIQYFARVNFNSVIKLVDAIGGIEVYSDKTFNSFHIPGWVVKKGMNKMNGQQALAFARERYAYKEGDRHRGQNQQQVIQRIIEKVTSSKTILTKSSDLLKAVDGTFETNLTTEEIMSLVNYQLDQMPKWSIESVAADGVDGYSTTYSYPNNEIYVMKPNQESVDAIKTKLEAFLKEE